MLPDDVGEDDALSCQPPPESFLLAARQPTQLDARERWSASARSTSADIAERVLHRHA